MKVTNLPFDPGPAAWNIILPPPLNHPALEENITTDVLIIGAGFAGLSAARRLKQLNTSLDITVVEARRVADGPAGRNSGFMIDLPHNLGSDDYAGQNETDRLQTNLNRQAISFALDAKQEYDMEEEALVKSGKINAAASSKGSRHNQDYAHHLRNFGEPSELLDAHQMQDVSGSKYYESGLFTPGTAILQPALYTRNFAHGLARDKIRIFENTPVIGLKKKDGVWHAETPQGGIEAPKVILAINGHAESFGHFKRQLIHVYLYASMTRALSKEEIKSLGGQSVWAFTPSDPMGSTVRKINGIGGTRIVIRNSISWAPSRTISKDKPKDFARIHDKSFYHRFPILKDVQMEYRWGGLLCLSRNAVPAFGELEKGLYSACCQNGLGTAIGTLSGITIAEKLLGERNERTEFFDNQPVPTKLPPEPLAAIGANALFKYREIRAGREL